LLVAGGGAAADLVRTWDRVHDLGEDRAHWLALESLRLSEALLASLMPRAVRVADRDEAGRAWRAERWPILAAADFVSTREPSSRIRLPHSWDATSDSVAAWIAVCWPADELVLLKSADLPEGTSFDRASKDGLVDPCFPSLARRLPAVGWVNFRDPRPTVRAWVERTIAPANP
jgi:aspartokinase-like uncharacterized kinase